MPLQNAEIEAARDLLLQARARLRKVLRLQTAWLALQQLAERTGGGRPRRSADEDALQQQLEQELDATVPDWRLLTRIELALEALGQPQLVADAAPARSATERASRIVPPPLPGSATTNAATSDPAPDRKSPAERNRHRNMGAGPPPLPVQSPPTSQLRKPVSAPDATIVDAGVGRIEEKEDSPLRLHQTATPAGDRDLPAGRVRARDARLRDFDYGQPGGVEEAEVEIVVLEANEEPATERMGGATAADRGLSGVPGPRVMIQPFVEEAAVEIVILDEPDGPPKPPGSA